MKIKLVSLLVLLSLASRAQNIQVTSRKTGEQLIIWPKKVKAVVNKNGEFFEGSVRPVPDYLLVGDRSIAYSQIGFIEVKKLHSRTLISKPLKWIGGGLGIVGGLLAAVAAESDIDENPDLLGAGVLMMGGGVLLLSLGEKTKPTKNSQITTLHIGEWKFSYGPKSLSADPR